MSRRKTTTMTRAVIEGGPTGSARIRTPKGNGNGRWRFVGFEHYLVYLSIQKQQGVHLVRWGWGYLGSWLCGLGSSD